MTASITAVAQPLNDPPRVQLTVSGATVGSVIQRTAATGSQTPVRGGEPLLLISGAGAVFDYEAPYKKDVTYQVLTAGVVAAATGTVNLDTDDSWLVNPVYPSLSQKINLVLTDVTETTNPGVELYPIPGRADPVPIGNGQRSTPSAARNIFTESETDEMAMDALLSGSVPLLAQIVSPTSTRTVYQWWSVGSVPKSTDGMPLENPWRQWQIAYTVVARPSGSVQAEWTYADVLAGYTSYQDLLNHYLTYTGVLIGVEGT